ncbi:23S rRNA (pseudouridine(1915)-N(3))-methyltransferase RlmH [Mycoplasma mycoides]|uniref:23S rRNA (pseudouridine(1915)-N(3))-methyltransferase RlmH n=1 Tax=Mycoplasma mycoides TaxID=2102 RepID=UPI00223F576E|nr:23S rRNA (pseudouridine(1915)-N(3))-methyltransferase RlmH [Mycoplasma mycoides]QVK03111.1 23S rRNA (pseudouridine(1915)-N(3))-methyltransferase RlmH [Mycoplasma mycoides subsp. capri]QVK03927.1 23S rRNA (pseudouridine(1915)-N(3))-methyltransferase RlmH [Mycoplasma mycoides subsp. capri]
MKIKIICFGKLDKKFYIDAFNDYFKRLEKYAGIEIIELKEEINGELNKIKELNSDLLLNKLESYKDFEKVILDVNSKLISTENLVDLIQTNLNYKNAKILFVIGPSDGYSKKFLNFFNNKISLAKITLPHQLCRIVLIEQIYRVFKIIKNEKYHK